MPAAPTEQTHCLPSAGGAAPIHCSASTECPSCTSHPKDRPNHSRQRRDLALDCAKGREKSQGGGSWLQMGGENHSRGGTWVGKGRRQQPAHPAPALVSHPLPPNLTQALTLCTLTPEPNTAPREKHRARHSPALLHHCPPERRWSEWGAPAKLLSLVICGINIWGQGGDKGWGQPSLGSQREGYS